MLKAIDCRGRLKRKNKMAATTYHGEREAMRDIFDDDLPVAAVEVARFDVVVLGVHPENLPALVVDRESVRPSDPFAHYHLCDVIKCFCWLLLLLAVKAVVVMSLSNLFSLTRIQQLKRPLLYELFYFTLQYFRPSYFEVKVQIIRE